MSDLVKRLRHDAEWSHRVTGTAVRADDRTLAADEIERLRGLLQRHYELRGKPAREEWVDGGPTYRLAMQLWRDTAAALAGAAVQPDECPACGRSTKRHPGYVLGNHWLESAYERICAGEAEDDVLRDYDVVRVTDQASAAPEAK